MNSGFPDFLQACQARLAASMTKALPAETIPALRLKQAMRYSVLNGGKRVRATLAYASARAITGDDAPPACDAVAVALELVHAYSLVHDDLPAMDDDNLRRGQPTCHIAFDEATAILAGDALQALAFARLASAELPADLRCQLVCELADAAGFAGMVGGQDMDLAAENRQISLTDLETLHRHKTGALIRASVRMGAMSAGCNQTQLAALTRYSEDIGLAFQVHDDILDIEGSTEELGKQQGADIALNKSTYPNLMGIEPAKAYAEQLCETATLALAPLGPAAEPLRELARYIVLRKS